MAKLTLREILALTRAGYKAAEIRQMAEEDDLPEPEPDQVPDDPGSTDEPETIVPEEPETAKQEEPDPGPDYKSLYEEAQRELKKAQKLNVRQQIQDPAKVSNEEYIKNLIEEFY